MTKLNVKACIWDMDLTLYQADVPYVPGLPRATARVLRRLGIGEDQISEQEVTEQVLYHFVKFGSSFQYFAERFAFDKHKLLDLLDEELDASEVPVDTRLRPLFAASGAKHVINTHANPVWCIKVLQRIGLYEFFPESSIIYHAHYNHAPKWESPATHEAALRATGHAAADVVMIDDMEKNLRIPKEMGMKTVLIAPAGTVAGAYADHVAPSAAAVFDLI